MAKSTATPAYWGILPASVRYDNELPPNAKVLFTEFTALTQKDGYCRASNSYFAELYGVSERVISKWISMLHDREHIKVEIDVKRGHKRKISMTPYRTNVPYLTNKSSIPYRTKVRGLLNTTSKNRCVKSRASKNREEEIQKILDLYPKSKVVDLPQTWNSINDSLQSAGFVKLSKAVKSYVQVVGADSRFIMNSNNFFKSKRWADAQDTWKRPNAVSRKTRSKYDAYLGIQ
jgi:hypothetical protein